MIVFMRLYWPKPEALDGTWKEPPVTQAPAQSGAPDAKKPKYSAEVPDFILTPNQVKTEFLGDLEFFDGMPSETTVRKVYDYLDFSRGVDTFLRGLPAASTYAALEAGKEAGMAPNDLGLFEQLMDARFLLLTANSTTMYAMGELNVKEGPVVIQVPPAVLGLVDDAFQRFVTDIGLTGLDQGQGGNYLFVHTSYHGKVPDGYFVVKTPTYRNPMFFRAFVRDGDLVGTADAVKAGFRMYPLARAGNPPEQKVVNLSGLKFNTIHANTFRFYEELNAVIQYEPADAFNPELVGLFASIGIKKGEPFAPDARMKRILTEAVAVGNASARALTFAPRSGDLYFYPDRQWYSLFPGGSHDFMSNGEMKLDDRTRFHYYGAGTTPAMAKPQVGTGSVYGAAARDSEGRYLDGGQTYQVTLPAPIPINNFWSFMVYSGQHRSMLETDQRLAGLDSNNPAVQPNVDGSYTMWFGPKAPEGHESNWIQTIPGKSYNVILRMYGPLESWFDKSWKPGDIELLD